ncbi:MAG: fibronectin type III domain-containing protein [Acidobacteria bacterium]|nr:fibronectin type III domain-containing protein [Acidobacteriota bacterium]
MRRLLVAVLAVLSVSLVGLQPASADTYPPCTITGSSASETLTGTSGPDVICTGGGNDTVNALDGNDIVIATGSGDLIVDAGGGNDTVDGSKASDLTVTAGTGDDIVYGSPGDDSITGGDGSDSVTGGAGADSIDGGLGEDNLSGDAGNDSITGGIGADTISGGDGNDTVQAGYGNDTVTGGLGDDSLSGEVGNDNLTGDSGNDTLNGGAGDDTISGGEGSDQITGEADIDTITGGEGDDTINAGDGNDDVDAGNGNDSITGGEGNDDLNGDAGNDTITGDTGDDTINGGDGSDTLNGTLGDDTLIGGAADDTINGGEGNDNLEGNTGNDNLYGQSGTDTLSGSAGDDIMAGGEGIDNLDGGEGLNVCDYTSGELLVSTCTYDDSAPSFSDVRLSSGSVDVGSSDASVNFHVVVDDQTGIYQVYFKCGPWPNGAFVKFLTFDGTSRRLVIDESVSIPFGLAPGDYSCDIFTIDTLGKSSNWVATGISLRVNRTPAGQPSVPIDFAYSQTTVGTQLNWNSPLFLGSPGLFAYVAEYSADGYNWLSLPNGATKDNHLSLVGLNFGRDYWFRVRGENGGTVGQDTTYMNLNWAVIKVTMPAATAPAKPSGFASSGVSSSGFQVGWGAPSDNGGSSVTDFRVEVSRNNGESWQSVKGGVSTSTSLTVSGAAPGTTYLVRVAAVNAVGQSEWLMGSVTTLTTTATAPKNLVSSNVTGTGLSLGWGLPDSNGGAGIVDYRVEVTSNGSSDWTVIPHAASNSLGFSVTNLQPGRTYQFRVAAVTGVGVGAYSNTITVTTPGAVGPVAPASLVVSNVKTATASLSWSGVIATQKVSNYVVDVSSDGSTWVPVSKRVSTSTSLALSGLKLGTSYQVRVAAVNSVGVGAYVYGSFTTLATVSSSPTGLVSSNLSSSGFTLAWNAPSSTGGAVIADYVVEVNGGGLSWVNVSPEVSSSNTVTVTGLNPAIKYSVRVKAVNSAGVSKASSTVTVTTLATTPGTVTNLTVKSVSLASTVLSWTAPTTGGSRITDYKVEYSLDQGQTWLTVAKNASSSTTVTLKGLKSKTSYLFRVTAKNSVGFGDTSNSSSVTTP